MKTGFRNVLRSTVRCSLLAIASLLVINPVAGDPMYANEYLYYGQRLASPGCSYHLDMQADGNLVLYQGKDQTTPWWASNTVGVGAYAVMQADGNFVVYNWNNVPVWASGTQGFWWSRLDVQNDGNLVIYSGVDVPLIPAKTSNLVDTNQRREFRSVALRGSHQRYRRGKRP